MTSTAVMVEAIALVAVGLALLAIGTVQLVRRQGASLPAALLATAGAALVVWRFGVLIDLPWSAPLVVRYAEPVFLVLASAGLAFAASSLMPRYVDTLRAELAARRRTEHEVDAVLQRERLLADVLSHDVRNALTGAMLRLDVLRMKHPELADSTSLVAGPLRRAADLIDRSILFLRLEEENALTGELTEVRVLVREAIDAVAPVAEREGVRVRVRISDHLTATANPLLGRAIENVLGNAVKWSPAGAEVLVAVSEGGDLCRISIADHGPGIEPADRDRIFGRFERVDRTGVEGSGLGLAITKRVLDHHGGDVWVEATPGGGATFIMQFPRSEWGVPYKGASAQQFQRAR